MNLGTKTYYFLALPATERQIRHWKRGVARPLLSDLPARPRPVHPSLIGGLRGVAD